MPLEFIERSDTLTNLITFRTSSVYEMLVSLHSLVYSRRQLIWANETRPIMGSGFMQKLETLLEPFSEGSAYFELAVNYDDHHDVPGFIEYVRKMDDEHFSFYMLGRLFTLEEIAATKMEPEALSRLVKVLESDDHYQCYGAFADWTDKIGELKRDITDLWEWYWQDYFAGYVPQLYSRWEASLHEKERFFAREGGEALYEQVTGRSELPPQLPVDRPYEKIEFVPIYLHPKRTFLFYGYGHIAVLYNSQHSEARTAEIEQAKENALVTLRALSDETRLNVLQLIAREERKINGKRIAEKLDMSPSAVSRHLAQLKEAGLIVESSADKRNLTYELQMDSLTHLPDAIMDYLYS